MSDRLTVSQVANFLNCHPETIRKLNRQGVIKAKRDYRGYRIFNKEDVLKLKRDRERLT